MAHNLFHEKKVLQSVVFLASLVPIIAGISGVLQGTGMVEPVADISLNSHVRYLSGLLLAIGAGFAICIPHIERKTNLFTLLTCIVFVGGLARLLSVTFDGLPDKPMLFGLFMELFLTPVLCFWQRRIAEKIPFHKKYSGEQ